jgi:two-component system, chemotaxis family, protein-glutamate methylesterase/glutaminase
MAKIKVLIVDDSPFMRKVLIETLSADPHLEVIGYARTGLDAIQKVRELSPDCVTMDIHMPEMDGITALKRIMKEKPTPVIVVSSMLQKDAAVTIEFLESGAIDFVAKPDVENLEELKKVVQQDIIKKILDIEGTGAPRNIIISQEARVDSYLLKKKKLKEDVAIALGISTGGPKNIIDVITTFPKDLDASIFIVQHMPEFFTEKFAERLDSISQIKVKEAENGEVVQKGVAYIGKGGYHLKVRKSIKDDHRYIIHLSRTPETLHVPSVDVMMESIVEVYKENTIGVLMTGMGRDGVDGMKLIKKYGGRTIAEDESTAVIFGMPGVAIAEGCVDRVAPNFKITQRIMEILYNEY